MVSSFYEFSPHTAVEGKLNAGKWRKRTLNNSESKVSITISNVGQVNLHIPCHVRALILTYSNRIDINFHSSVCQLQVIAEGRWLQTMLHEGSAAGCFLQPFYSMEGERFVARVASTSKASKKCVKKEQWFCKANFCELCRIKVTLPRLDREPRLQLLRAWKSDSKSQDHEKSGTLDSPGK